jgi:hypothetical protein
MNQSIYPSMQRFTSLLFLCGCCLASGCVTFTKHAIPAGRLPHQFEAPSKCNLNPINFAMLGRSVPAEHTLAAGDLLAIAVPGILPPETQGGLPPLISGQTLFAREYYPPNGLVDAPNFGVPLAIQSNGTVQLPAIAPVDVNGLTLMAAASKIAAAFVEAEVLRKGKDQVSLSLLRSRTNRVTIFREDASTEAAQLVRKGETTLHKRGSAQIVDLPINESDVLHALASSGGLPGIDAYNEIWVLRKEYLREGDAEQINVAATEGESVADLIRQMPAHVYATRIPLKLCPDEPVPFTSEDIELRDGDIVYIEPRRDEYFYTGGLLSGGQIPLPRDEDIDILEAIALAQGSVGGLGGTSSVAVLRAGAGVGNIIPPTRVLLLRKLPNGQQLPIRIDLNKAMKDPNERIKVMAGDYVMMYYKPSEMTTNAVLNFFNFNWVLQ